MTAGLMFLVALSILVGIYGIFWGESRPEAASSRTAPETDEKRLRDR